MEKENQIILLIGCSIVLFIFVILLWTASDFGERCFNYKPDRAGETYAKLNPIMATFMKGSFAYFFISALLFGVIGGGIWYMPP
jgi:hypothetical protein